MALTASEQGRLDEYRRQGIVAGERAVALHRAGVTRSPQGWLFGCLNGILPSFVSVAEVKIWIDGASTVLNAYSRECAALARMERRSTL
jgi:hypothetical protein